MTLGEKIRTRRKNLKITRDKLAVMTGISKKTLYNYETDHTIPQSRDVYTKLSQALELDITELFTASPKTSELEITDIKNNIEALFSGGKLQEDDMDELMLAVQEAYTIAKKKIKKEREGKYD